MPATAPKPKRPQVYWWMLPKPPICPKHGTVCAAYKTKSHVGEEFKTQFRKCPLCSYTTQTVIRK